MGGGPAAAAGPPPIRPRASGEMDNTMTTRRKETDHVIDVDYLIVGAGAMGMSFADVILTETDSTMAIVDRYGKPGGHWTRAYPYVRLHQPSAFYGVNSRQLGSGKIDAVGGNAGLFELASGSEIVTYFDQIMQQQFLPSGRVQYFPLSQYAEGGVASLASGERRRVRAKTIVDATYSQVTVPSMRPPPYDIADGVRYVPPNALAQLDHTPDRYVVIGAGKTGMDAILWLLDAGVDPDRVTWIMPRDSWLLDRGTIQPGLDFFESTLGGAARQMEAAALATSADELFERLESTGQLLRIDRDVRPTMYRCATVSLAELEQLRRIKNVVRMGRVRSISPTEIVLANGAIATTPGTLHIDCTANGLIRRPVVPIFAEGVITLQSIRRCQPTFSAALIGHVEAVYTDRDEKNDIARPVQHPDTDLDWLPWMLTDAINTARWNSDPDLGAWIRSSRLGADAVQFEGEPDEQQKAILKKLEDYTRLAIENLPRLIAPSPN
jgi:hypothetical protein